ncbi:MAG: transrane protein [Herbaspirillum sp.]|jgi:uncharacterized membrane protein|nr:transrane protein [Herbaspirillum sp.]
MSYFQSLYRLHSRLLIALAAGIITGLTAPARSVAMHLLIGWNVMTWLYMALIWIVMLRSNTGRVQRLAEVEDEGAYVVLVTICAAVLVSLGAIVFELAAGSGAGGKAMRYSFTVLTVLGSWLLMGTVFTLHYARMYYRAPDNALPLRFPDDISDPHYWDFLYFSFTIAVAMQTADIALMTRPMRMVVMAQAVMSFFFNAAIVGLSINIAAGLIA